MFIVISHQLCVDTVNTWYGCSWTNISNWPFIKIRVNRYMASISILIISPLNEVEGEYWFHIVRLSVCGQNRVHSVSSTVLAGSISYLHTLSSNFRRCVACKVVFKIKKIEVLEKKIKFITLTLFCFHLGSNMNWSIVLAWDPIWTGQ